MGTLLVMGSKERVGAWEELLDYWNGVNGEWIVVGDGGAGRHGDKELKGARL